jgi:hypothetical protein
MAGPDNRGKVWTAEHYQQLQDLYAADTSLLDICRTMGRTPSAILAKLQELGYLVNARNGYHKIDPDPWILWQSVVSIDEEFKKGLE